MEEMVRTVLDKSAKLAKPISAIKLNDNLYDAGLSSLSTVSIMLGLEETFDIEFTDELLSRETFRSIHSLMVAVQSLK